jgi:hypothetical protein
VRIKNRKDYCHTDLFVNQLTILRIVYAFVSSSTLKLRCFKTHHGHFSAYSLNNHPQLSCHSTACNVRRIESLVREQN